VKFRDGGASFTAWAVKLAQGRVLHHLQHNGHAAASYDHHMSHSCTTPRMKLVLVS
jgi:hypothetical protein